MPGRVDTCEVHDDRDRFATLATPPVPLVAPARVFDGFGWCASTVLEWRCATTLASPRSHALEGAAPSADVASVDANNPAGMAFVFRQACDFLPSELARLHAFGLGLTTETALAPWAIDDATDRLFERRAEPTQWLWLAADSLRALFWGLHDWAHFHNHGPFEERAWTELQCDYAALAWLRLNRGVIGLEAPVWERVRADVQALAAERFAAEGLASPDLAAALSSASLARALR
jgi:hypothetical protein